MNQIETEARAAINSSGRAAQDRAPGAVATAFAELSDRHQLVDHNLEQLGSLIDDLAHRLGPVLPDAGPVPFPQGTTDPSAGVPVPEDTRGMVARSLSSEARIADRQAAIAGDLCHRVSRLIEALEV